MTKIKGCRLLITGGASGIGRIMGRIALEKGAREVVVWDISEKNIAATEAELSVLGAIRSYRLDISDNEAVAQTFRQTVEECGEIDILINCAGIITSNNSFAELSQVEIDRTMAINALAPMAIAKHALPGMMERDFGHICNICGEQVGCDWLVGLIACRDAGGAEQCAHYHHRSILHQHRYVRRCALAHHPDT